MQIPQSELILNPDGSVYHLNLLPKDIAPKIIFVGDPERVSSVSDHFDKIHVKKQKREFVTHTGIYNSKEISVISTGIGTDNIDIVMNELDALFNIDLESRRMKSKKISLEIIRIGTSGCIQEEIPIDSCLVSKFAIGMDRMMDFYKTENSPMEMTLKREFTSYLKRKLSLHMEPYCFHTSEELYTKFNDFESGITLTHNGFYAPQGRKLRAELRYQDYINTIEQFQSSQGKITNFEMETAGIYGLSSLLGHKAVSTNLILANRANGNFSKNYSYKIKELIKVVLDRI